MKRLGKLFVFLALFCGLSAAVNAQSSVRKVDLSQQQISEIVRKFSDKEHEFRLAMNSYAFNRYATIHSIGLGGQITGEYRRDSYMTFTSDGKRFEKILFAPLSTMRDLIITPEDLENLGGVNAFALEAEVINLYNFNFVGKEKIDELDLYVFDVSPKVIPDPKKSKQLLFLGRIWVDDRDFQIVKSKGKAVPESKNNRFPIVETWRENIDGKYWFPAYASVTGNDGELVFDNGNVMRMKMVVRYTEYRLGRSDVRVLDDVEEPVKPSPTPTPKP